MSTSSWRPSGHEYPPATENEEYLRRYLDHRRRQLGVSYLQLGRAVKVPRARVSAFFEGRISNLVWAEIAGIAEVLDVPEPGQFADQYVAVTRGKQHGGLSIAGDNVQVNIGSSPLDPHTTGTQQPDSDPSKEAREHQQRFFFGFLGQALTQAWITFALSMIVTTIGATVLLVGASMALLNANDPNSNYAPLITSLSGLVMTVCGGAFTVHTFKARKHATDQANQVRNDIKDGIAFDHATSLIDKVKDEELRDRLYAITAVKELGLAPNPLNLAEHLPLQQQLPAAALDNELPPTDR